MTSSVLDIRDWEMVRPRLPRTARQLRAARSLSIEQAARLAPEWGRIEMPSAAAMPSRTARGR